MTPALSVAALGVAVLLAVALEVRLWIGRRRAAKLEQDLVRHWEASLGLAVVPGTIQERRRAVVEYLRAAP